MCVFWFFFYIMRKGTVYIIAEIYFQNLGSKWISSMKEEFWIFFVKLIKKLELFRGVYSIAQCSCKYLHKFLFVCLSFSIINFLFVIVQYGCPSSTKVSPVDEVPVAKGTVCMRMQRHGFEYRRPSKYCIHIYKSPRGRGLGLQALGTQKK